MTVETIQLHDAFGSGQHVAPRKISVYLPPDYHRDTEKRFPVLYLHDGQNLFDPQTSFAGTAWRVDQTAQRLIAQKKIPPLLIVGVDNTGEHRIDEYTPTRARGRGGKAEAYGQMLIEELKPFIDAHYRTRPERECTGLGGSSLGGLVSLHLGLQRHDVFSRLAVLSPSLWWGNGALLREVEALPRRLPLRIWLDIGGREGQPYKAHTRRLQDLLLQKGWQKHRQTRRADLRYWEAPQARHDEVSWGARFDKVLQFLFPHL